MRKKIGLLAALALCILLPDAAGTVQGERHSGFSWRAAVIIAAVLAGGAAAAAAIHIKRKKEKSN